MLELKANAAPGITADSCRRGGITLRALPALSMLRVQGIGDVDISALLGACLAIDLPQPGRFTQLDDGRCHWLTPREYLLVGAGGGEAALLSSLQRVAQRPDCHVSVISDSRFTVAVSGACAADYLSQGCSLDLHIDRFAPGAATVTRFAQLPAMLTRLAPDAFEITVDTAVAAYLWDWAVDAIDGMV